MAGVSGDNMSRRPAHFTQRDATRLMRATLAAGLAVQRIEVDRDGKLVVVTGEPGKTEVSGRNEWDQ
jgi:hypothetical protein